MPDDSGEHRVTSNLTVLCSPARVKIMRALSRSELAAGDLALVIGRTRAATSQHLRVLRDAGVVVASRRGNVVRYRLADGALTDVMKDIALRIDSF